MPTTAHFIYIPVVLVIGIVIGFILGGRAARDEAVELQARKDKRARERATKNDDAS
jgi:hypothetical protein